MAEEISLFDALRTQRSIRRFSPDPVPDEAITKIITAATWAPSPGNTQPWYFVVIRDPEVKDRVAEYCYQETIVARSDPVQEARRLNNPGSYQTGEDLMRTMGKVPVLILVCVDSQVGPHGPRVGGSTIYPAVQNLMLAARSLGLGTCLTTRYNHFDKEIKELLGIPDDVDTAALIPLGYPGDGERFGGSRRKPAEEVTFYDGWGQRATTL